MHRTTTRRRTAAIAGLAAAMGLLAPAAHASARASIEVSQLQVSVTSIAPGRKPGVSFAGAGGSTSTCEGTWGQPAATHAVSASGASAFAAVASALASDPAVGGTATLRGDAFRGGADVQASAHASSTGLGASFQSIVGLADDVSAAAFTLAPGTRMIITANVQASAWVDGTSPDDMADSGLSLTIADADGGGPQFARVSFDALALGAFGAYDDVETLSVSLAYENDTDAAIHGLFSGYVESSVHADDPDPVPEPGSAPLLLTGLALVAAAARSARP